MKNKKFKLTLIISLCIAIQSCGQQTSTNPSEGIIASKDGYHLTEKHFAMYVKALEGYEIETGDLQSTAIVKSELKQAFLEDPAGILKELNALSEDLDEAIDPVNYNINNLADGHRIVRQKLADDIGQMQFDSKAANDFRAFMVNSLLSSSSNSYDGIGFRSSDAQIQFCADGTFVQSLSGHVGIDMDGIGGSSSGADRMPGYWEVASLPNGTLIILFYSTHPLMLEDSPNGLLPFPVAQYASDFVALPNGDGYSRETSYCN